MKNAFKIITLFLSLSLTVAAACAGTPKSEKIVIGGSGWNQIAVVDKATKQVEWTHELERGTECNSVMADRKGNILYAYKQGARLIKRDGTVIWDYKADGAGAEVQYAGIIPSGFVVAICGNPSLIVELDRKGRPVREIAFETGTQKPHGQFRQVWPLGNGSYLVPLLSQGEVITVDARGEITDRVKVEGKPFSVKKTTAGTLIVSGGDGHLATEITPGGEVIRRIGQHDIAGITLGYVAQINPDENGNWLICNWLGHGADETQPHLIEIAPDGKVLWRFSEKEKVGKVSTAYQFTGK